MEDVDVQIWTTDDGRSAVTLFVDGWEKWTRSTFDHALALSCARTFAALHQVNLEDRRAA